MGNWYEELNTAYSAVKNLDAQTCSEQELFSAVDRFRSAAIAYAVNVTAYSVAINEKKEALRHVGKDDDFGVTQPLYEILFGGKSIMRGTEDLTTEELTALYYDTFSKIRSIKGKPASYGYQTVKNGLTDYIRKREIKTTSINVSVGDDDNGTEAEERGRICSEVIASDSAEIVAASHETNLELAQLLQLLAKEYPLGFFAFLAAVDFDTREKNNDKAIRCRNKSLHQDLVAAVETETSNSNPTDMAAAMLWRQTISRYRAIGYKVEYIEMPQLFSKEVDQLYCSSDKTAIARLNKAAEHARTLLKQYF